MNRESQAAGQELLAKAEAYERQHKVSFSEAMRAVAAANSALARAWGAYTPPLRVAGDPGQVLADQIDQMVQSECVTFAEATRRVMAAADPELVRAYHAGEPYRGAQQSRPRQPVDQHPLRRLREGEAIDPAKCYVMKMATPDVGGGRFELVGV
jgi:hypothetical protein